MFLPWQLVDFVFKHFEAVDKFITGLGRHNDFIDKSAACGFIRVGKFCCIFVYLFEELGFRTFLEQIDVAGPAAVAESAEETPSDVESAGLETDYRVVNTDEAFEAFVEELAARKTLRGIVDFLHEHVPA